MKKQTVIGIIIGAAVGTAATVAGILLVRKIVKEIRSDLDKCTFTSPDGDNEVTLTYGSSKFAKGLTFIRVKANTVSGKNACKLVLFTKNGTEPFDGEWDDNGNFRLLVGNGSLKQCCDVNFEGTKINANYCLRKVALEDSAEKLLVEDN